jgi:hypothetical protein
MAKIAEILDDLGTPLNEGDPKVQEELFPVLKEMGTTPEKLTGTTEGVREAYAVWLKTH